MVNWQIVLSHSWEGFYFLYRTENDVPGRDAEFLRQFIGGHKKLR